MLEHFDVYGSAVEGLMVEHSAVDTFAAASELRLDEALYLYRDKRSSAVDCSAVDRSAVDGSAVDGTAVDGTAVDGKAVDGKSVDCSAVDRRAVDCSTVDGSAVDEKAADSDNDGADFAFSVLWRDRSLAMQSSLELCISFDFSRADITLFWLSFSIRRFFERRSSF